MDVILYDVSELLYLLYLEMGMQAPQIRKRSCLTYVSRHSVLYNRSDSVDLHL